MYDERTGNLVCNLPSQTVEKSLPNLVDAFWIVVYDISRRVIRRRMDGVSEISLAKLESLARGITKGNWYRNGIMVIGHTIQNQDRWYGPDQALLIAQMITPNPVDQDFANAEAIALLPIILRELIAVRSGAKGSLS